MFHLPLSEDALTFFPLRLLLPLLLILTLGLGLRNLLSKLRPTLGPGPSPKLLEVLVLISREEERALRDELALEEERDEHLLFGMARVVGVFKGGWV